MPFVRLVLLAAASLVAFAGYLQERRRLVVVQRLSGEAARDFYEAGRRRDAWILWAVTALLFTSAIAAGTLEVLFSTGPAVAPLGR